MMSKTILILIFLVAYTFMGAQKVGIGTTTPAAKLDIRGVSSNPSIPGFSSTGILRISINPNDAIDIGKLNVAPYSAWIQSGYNGIETDPISLQPSGGGVGIGIIGPEISAALDINSTTRGFLPPRMTMVQRNTIDSPVAGLQIWCINCGVYGQAQVYNGHIWTGTAGNPVAGTPIIGDADGGGVVAYIFQPGDAGYVAGETHGLIAKETDQIQAPWGCQGIELPGAEGEVIGTGNQNTLDIVAGCSSTNIAAYICKNLVHEGYDDWYLPSKDELLQIFLNKNVIGGFENEIYLSSTEGNYIGAHAFNFGTGQALQITKESICRVRAIRTF